MNKTYPLFLRCAFASGLALCASTASAYDIYLDDFFITKGVTPDTPLGTSVFFWDSFDDGIPPLTGVGGRNYATPTDVLDGVSTATFGPEVNGELNLNSADGINIFLSSGDLATAQIAILQTATTGTLTSTNSLNSSETFLLGASFQLTALEEGQRFGIRFQDRATNIGVTGEDNVQLRVMGNALGETVLQMVDVNDTTGEIFIVGETVLDTSYGYIGLALSNGLTGNNQEVLPGYSYLDADGNMIDVNGNGLEDDVFTLDLAYIPTIFNGQDYTRAVFFAMEPVPEPETWAMLLAGLGLIGVMRRRHAQS